MKKCIIQNMYDTLKRVLIPKKKQKDIYNIMLSDTFMYYCFNQKYNDLKNELKNYKILLDILEKGIGTTNYNDTKQILIDFYSEQGVDMSEFKK